MKRLIIIAAFLASSALLYAQSSSFPLCSYTQIRVGKGWNVTLVQRDAPVYDSESDTYLPDSLTVELPGLTSRSGIFRIEGGMLHILPNRSYPKSSSIRIITTKHISRIDLDEDACLSMGNFEGFGELVIAQRNHSVLNVDTLSSVSLLLGFKGDSCFFHCNAIRANKLVFDEDEGHPIGTTFDNKCLSYYSGDPARLMPMGYADEAGDVAFLPQVSLNLGLGVRVMNNIANNEVYNSSNTFFEQRSFDIPIQIYANMPLSPKWNMHFGLQYDWYRTDMYSNMQDPSELPQYGFDPEYFRSSWRIIRHFVGVPVSIIYHPFRANPSALGFQAALVPSFQVLAEVKHEMRTNSSNLIHSIYGLSELNPFRLELQLGIHSDIFGIFHGVNFFVNLLPTYIGIPDNNKYHEMGFSLYL